MRDASASVLQSFFVTCGSQRGRITGGRIQGLLELSLFLSSKDRVSPCSPGTPGTWNVPPDPASGVVGVTGASTTPG